MADTLKQHRRQMAATRRAIADEQRRRAARRNPDPYMPLATSTYRGVVIRQWGPADYRLSWSGRDAYTFDRLADARRFIADRRAGATSPYDPPKKAPKARPKAATKLDLFGEAQPLRRRRATKARATPAAPRERQPSLFASNPRARRPARRARRNPHSEQLDAALLATLGRMRHAEATDNTRGAAYWLKVGKRQVKAIEEPEGPESKGRHEFLSFRNKFGAVIHVPVRYGLKANDAYDADSDRRAHARAKRLRDLERLDELGNSDELLERASRSHQRRASYDPAHAKKLRERRKREISISPTATKKEYAAAVARAGREGKTLVERKRAGGSSIAQQDYFARRTGN